MRGVFQRAWRIAMRRGEPVGGDGLVCVDGWWGEWEREAGGGYRRRCVLRLGL